MITVISWIVPILAVVIFVLALAPFVMSSRCAREEEAER